jgi:hypothetical protein
MVMVKLFRKTIAPIVPLAHDNFGADLAGVPHAGVADHTPNQHHAAPPPANASLEAARRAGIEGALQEGQPKPSLRKRALQTARGGQYVARKATSLRFELGTGLGFKRMPTGKKQEPVTAWFDKKAEKNAMKQEWKELMLTEGELSQAPGLLAVLRGLGETNSYMQLTLEPRVANMLRTITADPHLRRAAYAICQDQALQPGTRYTDKVCLLRLHQIEQMLAVHKAQAKMQSGLVALEPDTKDSASNDVRALMRLGVRQCLLQRLDKQAVAVTDQRREKGQQKHPEAAMRWQIRQGVEWSGALAGKLSESAMQNILDLPTYPNARNDLGQRNRDFAAISRDLAEMSQSKHAHVALRTTPEEVATFLAGWEPLQTCLREAPTGVVHSLFGAEVADAISPEQQAHSLMERTGITTEVTRLAASVPTLAQEKDLESQVAPAR